MASRRLRKTREDPTVRVALGITTPEQARRGDLKIVDISNHSDGDQRHMVRSGERRTVRRQSKVDELKARGLLDEREAAACQWYAEAHALRYDTLGVTAAYGDGSRSGKTNFDHLPKTPEQECAWLNFDFARAAISPPIRPMFERVVLHGWPVGKLGFLLKLAARQLIYRLEGAVNF